jgi:transposase
MGYVEGIEAATRFDTQIVGALPVLTQYLERLQLSRVIDRVVPWEGEVALGTVVEALVLNRLLRPKAMFRLDEWAQQAGVSDYLGLGPGRLNDDRLGRALERVAAHADEVQAELVLGAVRRFGLDVSQVHYDITSVELFGAYEQAESAEQAEPAEPAEGKARPAPLPAYGRTTSGRKNVKQVQLGLDVSGDGGVPLAHATLDGNTAEATTHVENLRRLRGLLPAGELLYVADTKLDTAENLLTVAAGGGRFLCGGVFSPAMQKLYLAGRKKLRPVDYYPKSQEKLKPEERPRYEAFESPAFLKGQVGGKTHRLHYRQLFVWSQAKAEQEAATRERHLAKVTEAFDAVRRNLNRYSLKTRDAIVRRLEAARGKYAEGELLGYELSEDRQGRFHLQWQLRQQELQEWKKLEGVYLLKTNLPSSQCPMAKTLAKYKEQSKVENRFHCLKGPLAVAPVFLKNPQRIAGLMCVLVWSLMVLALMERQVRRGLGAEPLYGLYPENRPCPAPTGPALLNCFSTLCVVIIKLRGTVMRRLAQPSHIQQKLLRLLGIPPDALRTFKRRCGM